MKYVFEKMTQKQAEDIAYNWHYDGKYSFYDLESDQEDLAEFLDPEKRGKGYFAVTYNEDVIGFFSFEQPASDTVNIGLGMRPDLTGSGKGREFVQAGVEFAKENYSPDKITLSVATFNNRAIKKYIGKSALKMPGLLCKSRMAAALNF